MIINNVFILSFIVLFFEIYTVRSEVVRALAVYIENQLYDPLIYSFKKYAKENNLDVVLVLEDLDLFNKTGDVKEYSSLISSYLNRKSKKYDIYFYYSSFSESFGEHLSDLSLLLPKEHIDMYDKNIVSDSCTYKNKIVGLPLSIFVSTLYSNNELLKKYDKSIPETWDELIETGKYIWNEEKKLNNNNLIIYNGLFDDSDYGFLSLYEFMNSYRNSNDSPYPKITSNEANDALKMMKRLKNEIGSEYIFKLSNTDWDNYISNGNALFIKNWYKPYNATYNVTALPGGKKGVSGTVANGFNIGINEYITDKKKRAAAEVVKYLTSREAQKEYIVSKQAFSGISSFLDDSEACSILDCNVAKSAQPFSSVKFNNTNPYSYQSYCINYQNFIYDYLYRDEPLDNVVRKIDDMTRFYIISIKSNDSVGGLIVFILVILGLIIMVLSSIFLFLKKFKYVFKDLPKTFWLSLILGSILILSTALTLLETITQLKCKLRMVILHYGFTLITFPILYFLIINFPHKNGISTWVRRNKYTFSFLMIGVMVLFSILLIIGSTTVRELAILGGKNFRKCNMYKSYGKIFFYIVSTVYFIILLIILRLIHLEWRIKEIHTSMKFFLASTITTIIAIIAHFVFYNVKIRDFVLFKLFLSLIFIIFSYLTFTFNYGLRVALEIMKRKLFDQEYIRNNESIVRNMFSHVKNYDITNKDFFNNFNNSKNKRSYSSNDITNVPLRKLSNGQNVHLNIQNRH